ncbi:LuxR family transcriptional regulator [Phyllobacterium sophorae]|uniref:HTH luxR-type domain-containing protein n=1 Tax=Phyllobacterium sophorae TaxID=1520277 RepID=A0A2P7B6T0_9HYPH|nr:LuxR family transcriptional regulator [Phyllobacterium sophorae]PSH62175.1 hypothetical protein CU103_20280 [Phyllobacterium sophorae]
MAKGGESFEAYRASLAGQPFMFPDAETFTHCVDLVRDGSDLIPCLGQLCRRIGFEFFSLLIGDVGACDQTSDEKVVESNYPEQWRSYYREKQYILIDPVAFYAQRSTEPFFWGRDEDIRNLNPDRRQLMNESREIGIAHGISVPTHGPGGELTVLSMISGEGLNSSIQLAKRNRNLLWMIAPMVHASAVNQYRPRRPEAELMLTDTQRKCLRWTLHGKTSWEISRILSLSKATVDYHLQRAMRKLEAVSKVQAANEAFRKGLL